MNSDLDTLVEKILSGNYKNIIVMSGAGISVAAGIPDFRSPTIGLYATLREAAHLKWKSPTFVFNIDVFMDDPRPFWWVFGRLWPRSDWPLPTTMHYLISLLHKHDLLLRLYTQNVDGLEELAGLPLEKIIYSHGVLNPCHCLDCHEEISLSYCLQSISSNFSKPDEGYENITVPICPKCGNNHIKPDVTFFGENLPQTFFQLRKPDFEKCDLLIVTGTSLQVYPFAGLISNVNPDIPRFLINRDKVKEIGNIFNQSWNWIKSASTFFLLDFSGEFNFGNGKDFYLGGDLQERAEEILLRLNWIEEKNELENNANRNLHPLLIESQN